MDQSIWEKNREALSMVYPHILEYLEQNKQQLVTEEDNFASEFSETASDNPENNLSQLTAAVETAYERKVLYVEKNGKQFLLDSLYDNKDILNIWFNKKTNFTFRAKIYMFGLGNGMYVRKILESAADDVTVIVYEPSKEILKAAMEEFDFSELIHSHRVTIICKVKARQRLEEYFYELLDYRDIEGLTIRTYLNYVTIFPKEFVEFHSAIQKVCNSILATQDVIGRYGKIYYENTFANLEYFINSQSLEGLYKNIPKGFPAIIVAAGPSLDKNVQELKKAKGKAFIIAVDTALRPLLRNGIRPDIFISIDGKKVSTHFTEPETSEIPMVCYLLSHSVVLREHKNMKFFVNDLNHHIQHYLSQHEKLLPVISSGGSVANDAFSIAHMLGFKTIIMVGQDLAYTDNKTHSQSTVRGEQNIDATTLKIVMVEGVDGRPIASSTEFNLYRAWFEEQIQKYSYLKVIDATEGGAKIQGTIIQTLAATIEEECTQEMNWAEIIKLSPDFFEEQEKVDIWNFIKQLPKELEYCLSQTQRGIRDYDKMIELVYKDRYHTNELKRLFADAKEVGDGLENNPAMDYVRNRIQIITTEFIKDIYRIEDDEKKELLVACNKSRDYLKVIENEIKIMLPDIREKLENF